MLFPTKLNLDRGIVCGKYKMYKVGWKITEKVGFE